MTTHFDDRSLSESAPSPEPTDVVPQDKTADVFARIEDLKAHPRERRHGLRHSRPAQAAAGVVLAGLVAGGAVLATTGSSKNAVSRPVATAPATPNAPSPPTTQPEATTSTTFEAIVHDGQHAQLATGESMYLAPLGASIKLSNLNQIAASPIMQKALISDFWARMDAFRLTNDQTLLPETTNYADITSWLNSKGSLTKAVQQNPKHMVYTDVSSLSSSAFKAEVMGDDILQITISDPISIYESNSDWKNRAVISRSTEAVTDTVAGGENASQYTFTRQPDDSFVLTGGYVDFVPRNPSAN